MTINIPPEVELSVVGVVLGANPHIPALLTSEFLTKNGVVPTEWVVQESMSSAHEPRSQIAYENLYFQLDEDVLRIFEKYRPESENGYDVFDVALKYMDKTSGSYHTVGLNMNMHILHDHPSEWIGNTFYKEEKLNRRPHTRVIETGFGFSLDTEHREEQKDLFINFDSGSIIHLRQETQQAIIINAGVILKSQNKSSLKEQIAKWNNTHNLILNYVGAMVSEG